MIKTARSEQKSNYQDLLKTIAIVLMIIDHVPLWLFPASDDILWMRALGRFVMPIFCFYAGYNYSKPKQLLLYLGLLLTALILIVTGSNIGGNGQAFNMLITIYLGQWYLYLMDKYNKTSDLSVLVHCTALLLITPFTGLIFDYGTLAIAYMIAGRHQARGHNGLCLLPLLSISTMLLAFDTFSNLRPLYMALALCCTAASAISIAARKPEAAIPINLRYIARHSLIIYFVNVASFAMIFYVRFFLMR